MRHGVSGFKLKRNVAARNSLLRGLVTSVIESDFVITTVPKAKAVRPLVDKMITLAKEDTLHSRRQAAAFLRTPASVQKLFDKLGTKFGQRNGGYTRIVRLGWRKGDGAELAKLELVGTELVKRAAERAKRREERLKAVQEGREHEERRARRIITAGNQADRQSRRSIRSIVVAPIDGAIATLTAYTSIPQPYRLRSGRKANSAQAAENADDTCALGNTLE